MAENDAERHRARPAPATTATPSISKQHRGPRLMLTGVGRPTQSSQKSIADHDLPETCPFQHCSYKPKCRDTLASHMRSEHLREPSVKQSTTNREPLSDLTGIFSKIWDSREELSINLECSFDNSPKEPGSFTQSPVQGLEQWIHRLPRRRLKPLKSHHAPRAKLSLPSSNDLSLPTSNGENLAKMQDLDTPVDLSFDLPSPSLMTTGDDKAPTDSGYGSVRGLPTSSAAKIKKWSPEEISIIQSCVDDDMRTSYSAESGLDVVSTQNYVSELSQEIYYKLQPHLGVPDRAKISREIPELIQAFSIRLGHESPAQVNQDIMHFMLRSYRLISNQLESLIFKQTKDEHVDFPHEDTSSMSVSEKMKLWGQNLAVDALQAGSFELSERLKDDENTLLPSAKARTYSNIIFNSAAYEWLVERLKRDFSSERDTTQSSTTLQDIRRKILAKLPIGNTSTPYAPNKYLVAFQLKWEPMASRLGNLFGKSAAGAGKGAEIGDLTTITESSDGQLQATKARGYLKQTWPSGGSELLHVLSNVFRNSGRLFHSCNLPDSTRLTACLWESELLVTLHGTASSIAECGEQLGWLASAFRSPQGEGVSYNTPSITDPDDSILQILPPVYSTNDRQQDAASGARPFVGFKIEIQEKLKSPYQTYRLPWSRYIDRHSSSVIVEGYPTARRPEHFPGLELNFDVLSEAVGPIQVTTIDDITRLQGASITLQLINIRDGVCYWEENPSSETLADADDRLKDVCDESILLSSRIRLEASRHVIREVACAPSQKDGSEAVPSGPSPPESDSVLETSIDSGMLSVPSGSMGSERPEREGMGLRIFKDIFRRLVLTYYARAHGEAHSVSKGPSSMSQSKQTSSKSQTSLGRSGLSQDDKRQREDDEDNERGPPRKRAKPFDPLNPEKPKFLACPFWKLNPREHCSCFFKKMTKIAYVKQHLTRRHTSGLYCQRCFMIFENEHNLDRHVTGVPCVRDPSARLQVVSQRQSLRLSAKSKGTVEDQWYAMWHILFPTDPRPSSIHVDADGPQDLALFREFSQKHGLVVMLEEFRSRNLLPTLGTSYAELETILSRGLDALFEHYRLNEPPPTSSDSQSSSNGTRNHSHQSTRLDLQDDSQDSGVQMSLQPSLHQSSLSSRQEYDIYGSQMPSNNAISAQSSHEMSQSVDQLTEQENSSDPWLLSDEPSMHLPELPWEPWQGTQIAPASPNLDALLENFTELEDE